MYIYYKKFMPIDLRFFAVFNRLKSKRNKTAMGNIQTVIRYSSIRVSLII